MPGSWSGGSTLGIGANLAVGRSGDDGRYRVRYRVPEDTASPVLLLVEATSDDLPAPLTSDLTRAQPTLQIDLSFEPADQSQWATLVRGIEPLLDGMSLTDLVEDASHQDISFLSQELGRDTETIMRVALSARFEAIFDVPAPACYAFLAQHVPAGLPSPLLDASQNFTLIGSLIQRIGSMIFALSPATQTSTLTAAIALGLIGSKYTSDIAAWVNQLQSLRSNDLLNQPYSVGNTTLAQLLDTAALPAIQQQAFATALASTTQSMRNFWRTLGDGTHGLTAAEASTVERTLSVGAFVKNHVPLVQVLLQGFATGAYTSLPDLARITLPQWTQMVQQTGAPSGVNPAGSATAAEVFASVVYTRVTRAYPTAALSSRITTSGLVPPALQNDLSRFFQNNPNLELVKESLPAYLAANGSTAWTGIDASRQADVVAGARRLQRVLRVAPRVDVAETLLTMGVGSATEIANLGEQRFFVQATTAGLTKPEASNVYKVAASRYAQIVALYLKFNTDSVNLLPNALGQLSDLTGLAQQAVDRDESLATLFGSQDNCATDDCTSVLSPAAYLCDLLLWLRNHQQVGYTVLDVLDSRRPDIRHLLLNCPNTDTELPYIDLVNELLADKISPPVDSVATSFMQRALQDGTTYYYVVTAVNAKGESAPSPQVSVTPEAPAGAPAAPSGLVATAGDARVTLNWSQVSGAASYNVYWSTTPGVTTGTGTRIAGVTNPYTQTGLTNGTPYYYIVTAVNADGEGAPSSEASATPAVPVAVPAAPGGLTALADDGEVTISWTQLADADSYNLYWSTTPGVTPATGTRIPGVTSPYVQTELTDATQVYYVLTAVNAVGESAPTAEASAIPAAPATVPSAPTGVVAVAGDGQATIDWNPVAGATSYNIYWSTSSSVTPANGTAITGDRNPRWKQTSADKTADELAAAPEYFNQGAFATLFGASYPMSLPFSAGLDDLRTYLQYWRVPLWQLRQALLPLAAPTLTERSAVAGERFQIPPHGHDLTVQPNFVPAAVAWNTATPASDLVPVDAFCQAASITYEQLQELLQATWVQGGIGVSIQGINDACMTSQESLAPAPLDSGFLDRAHRFLRLWNAANVAIWELNELLQAPAVGNGALDDNALVAMASFRQLQDSTRLPVDEQLAFFQDIDTASHRNPDGTPTVSLDARLFLNPTVTSIAPDPDLDVLPAGGTISDPALSDHQSAIQAASQPLCGRRHLADRAHRQPAEPEQPQLPVPSLRAVRRDQAGGHRSRRAGPAALSRLGRSRRARTDLRRSRCHARLPGSGEGGQATRIEPRRHAIRADPAGRYHLERADHGRRHQYHRGKRRRLSRSGLLHRHRSRNPPSDRGRRSRAHHVDRDSRPTGNGSGRGRRRSRREPDRGVGDHHADDPRQHCDRTDRDPAGCPGAGDHLDCAHHGGRHHRHRGQQRSGSPTQLLRVHQRRGPARDGGGWPQQHHLDRGSRPAGHHGLRRAERVRGDAGGRRNDPGRRPGHHVHHSDRGER